MYYICIHTHRNTHTHTHTHIHTHTHTHAHTDMYARKYAYEYNQLSCGINVGEARNDCRDIGVDMPL